MGLAQVAPQMEHCTSYTSYHSSGGMLGLPHADSYYTHVLLLILLFTIMYPYLMV
jgi:hypothetical protein